MVEAALTGQVIGAFYSTYDALGFGFLESVYCNALALELRARGISFRREAPIDVWMRGVRVGHFRADFVVEDGIVLEVKASRTLDEGNRRQLLNYLRATKIEIGLLLHFGPKPEFHRYFMGNSTKASLTPRKSA